MQPCRVVGLDERAARKPAAHCATLKCEHPALAADACKQHPQAPQGSTLRPRRYQDTRPAAMLFIKLPPCAGRMTGGVQL